MRIILHPSRCPNSVLRACALRLFAGVGPPLRALFCCPAAPGGWNPGAKTGGTLLSRPFFWGCAGGAPDLSAAMTRPCLRDAGTYDFRTKWFLIFFQKNRNPLFFYRPATLPSCHLAARYPVARRLAARRLAARRPVTLPPAARCPVALTTAALSPCHLAARRPAAGCPVTLPTRPNGACRFLSLPSVRGKSACGETPFLHDLTRAATKKRPRRGSFSLCRVSGQPQI